MKSEIVNNVRVLYICFKSLNNFINFKAIFSASSSSFSMGTVALPLFMINSLFSRELIKTSNNPSTSSSLIFSLVKEYQILFKGSLNELGKSVIYSSNSTLSLSKEYSSSFARNFLVFSSIGTPVLPLAYSSSIENNVFLASAISIGSSVKDF